MINQLGLHTGFLIMSANETHWSSGLHQFRRVYIKSTRFLIAIDCLSCTDENFTFSLRQVLLDIISCSTFSKIAETFNWPDLASYYPALVLHKQHPRNNTDVHWRSFMTSQMKQTNENLTPLICFFFSHAIDWLLFIVQNFISYLHWSMLESRATATFSVTAEMVQYKKIKEKML